jgi:hypothetical protein
MITGIMMGTARRTRIAGVRLGRKPESNLREAQAAPGGGFRRPTAAAGPGLSDRVKDRRGTLTVATGSTQCKTTEYTDK